MLTTIFIIYLIFVSLIVIGISFLLIQQDKEIRRLKSVIKEQSEHSQDNTKELEKFYAEKKQLQTDKDSEIAEIQARLDDERSITALAVKNSENVKLQLKQIQEDKDNKIVEIRLQLRVQHEELIKLKSEAHQLSEELQKANETRLMEVQKEAQKWTDVLDAKEIILQKFGSEATSMESVMDTLALISKEMHRRLDEHYSKMKLLDEKTQENLELMAQLEH